jgi:HlyD family secretion protein
MGIIDSIKNRKKLLLTALIVVGIGTTGWYYKASSAKGAQMYKTQKLENGDLTQTVSANGTLNPVVLVNVGTQVSGTVKKLLVDYNDKVTKGQVLAILDPALFDAQVAQSRANVESAKATLELAEANEKRMKELYAKEYVSAQELDQAVQARKSAKAQLALAMAAHKRDSTNKEYSVIKSPVSGVVIDRQIDLGQTVAASFQTPTLFKIAQDLRRMQIDSSFAEADIGKIKVGQEVTFNVDAYNNRQFKGVVKQIRLNATTQSNVVTYNVVVSVDNPEEILMPGMTAYVNIKTAERKNVLLVPNAALRYKPSTLEKREQNIAEQKQNKKPQSEEGKSATVYILENGAPKPVKIKIGITDSRQTEVLDGALKAGDEVIVDENSKNDKKQNQPTRMF